MPNIDVLFENARIIFRNFAGKEGKFNKAGDRNFCLVLDDVQAEEMLRDGWNVKYLRARNEDEQPQPYLSVAVNFEGPRPPTVVLITSRGRTTLPADLCVLLDWADIANVDLIINAFDWEFNGRHGRKAYLKSIYVTIREDPLERKYASVPEIGSDQMAIEAGPIQAWDYEGVVVDDGKALGR